jgi:glycine oxidase
MTTHRAEAIVIGGGVMGMAMARELARRGNSVTLLERAQPGRAASWASAGIIGATSRDESDPASGLRRVSNGLWPAFAEMVQAESGLDPEYRQMGCLHLASNEAELGGLMRAGQRQSDGADRPELLDAKQLYALEPALGPGLHGGLLVSGGNVDNRRLCRALEIAALRAGVRIEPGVEVQSITIGNRRVTGVATTAGQSLPGDLVVLAAGAWSGNIRNARPSPPVAPQRGQIFALDQSSVGIKHVLLTPGDPYFVPRCDGRLVIGATREEAGWDPSLTAGGMAWLLNRAIDVVPALRSCPIAEMWTGFRPASADGLPLIGQGEFEGLYFLTGHGPSGIAPLPGSIALLMALIAGERPPLSAEPFDPLRFEPPG